MTISAAEDSAPKSAASLGDLWQAFGRIGLLSFGGPAAQIALMHKVLVDEKKWLSEKQYLNALSFCMLLPGPEAMQLATYAGWRLQGVAGGLIAGLLFVLPGAFFVLCLATIYAYFGNVPLVEALFIGVKAAVVAIVIEALMKVAKRALIETQHWILAGLAFVGIFFLSVPFPLLILAAALYGAFFGGKGVSGTDTEVVVRQSWSDTARTVTLWLFIWLAPLALLWATAPEGIMVDIGFFFSKLAVVTFGGAYAVLAYMAQDVVNHYGWLDAGEMMDGLGLAETTPGPLILVTEFVGFLAGFKAYGFAAGVAAALITLWVTFAPCFLWIFAGAPYIEWISAQPRLRGALTAITAAVVGVILNLSLWFALHVFFERVTREEMGPFLLWLPDLSTLSLAPVLLAILCGILLLRLKWQIAPILGVSAALALVLSFVGL
ncbi:MAG: chromate efflux transporter [Pseudomonadota bacterium]